jgi:hypothetical protein
VAGYFVANARPDRQLDVPIVVYRGRAGRERHRRRPRANDDDRGDPRAAADGAPRRRARGRGASLKRSTLAPDIPTTAEVGLPQLAFGALCTTGPFRLGKVHRKGRRGDVHD